MPHHVDGTSVSSLAQDELIVDRLPLCIGAQLSAHNPDGFPDVCPFSLGVNMSTGALQRGADPALDSLLRRAYSLGLPMGTPSDDSEAGRAYVDDFLRFIGAHASPPGRALEIGAGVGYLSARLRQGGWAVDAIEPGEGYADQWTRHGIEVIADLFPTPRAKGPYDLIVFYTVLEHIAELQAFLDAVTDHLSSEGLAVLAVPDCTAEIDAGDPGMLLHEHCHYFTESSLCRTLEQAGLRPIVAKSTHGRTLFAAARAGSQPLRSAPLSLSDLSPARGYAQRVRATMSAVSAQVVTVLEQGTLGIYCPSRALAVMPQDLPLRFFDDAPWLHGRFYPPFKSPVESRAELIARPPDVLWVMSRTFGAGLQKQLAPNLPRTRVERIDELVRD